MSQREGYIPEEFLGQILMDGKWVDFARGTEEASRQWIRSEKRAGREARVVDWIQKDRGPVLFSTEDADA